VNAGMMRNIWPWMFVILMGTSLYGVQMQPDAEAIRLNNRGVALMGQQFTERAADAFAQAFRKDPRLAQAATNEGIALLTLQKLDDAKSWLQKSIAIDIANVPGLEPSVDQRSLRFLRLVPIALEN